MAFTAFVLALLSLLSLLSFSGVQLLASAQLGGGGIQDPAMTELTDMCRTKELPTEACKKGRIEIDPGLPFGHIENHAFEHSIITSVTIPKTIYSIGDAAFFNTKYLKYVTIPSSVETIGNSAFKQSSLTTIDFSIAESLLVIDDRAFQRNNLKKIEIPPKVISIGKYAFVGNPLVSACFRGEKAPKLDEDAFPENITLQPCNRNREL